MQPSLLSISRIFHYLFLLNNNVPFLGPQSLVTTILLSVSMTETIIDRTVIVTSHKHNHTIFVFLCLAYLIDGEGNGNPLQYSCLENPMDRGAWWATIHGVTKSRTRLSDFCVCVFRGLSITPPHFHHLIFFFFGI